MLSPGPASLPRKKRGHHPSGLSETSVFPVLLLGASSSAYFAGFSEVLLKECAPHPGSGARGSFQAWAIGKDPER